MRRGDPLDLPGKMKPYVMAHRGNRVACPENTLTAFQRAFDEGADILETDLRLSADGAFVCIHDETVDRTTNGAGAVSEMTLSEIKKLSAAYGHPGFEAERVPMLAELTEILPPGVSLALELKDDQFLAVDVCRRLLSELDRAGVRERTVVLSFSLARVLTVQSIAPDIPIGWITVKRAMPLRGVQFLGPLWPLLILNPFYVRLAHFRGQMVGPLDPTPDSRLWLYRWLGCDVVLSDDPGATIQALGRRGDEQGRSSDS
jgi:glycerophosphoryl diester phosphodiesterase